MAAKNQLPLGEEQVTPCAGGEPTIPCVSVRQPWAEQVLRGASPTIPLDFSSDYRGLLLVHAGKRWADDGGVLVARDGMMQRMFEVCFGFSIFVPDCVARGCVVGAVTLVEVDAEAEHTPYDAIAPMSWRVIKPLRFARPIPWRGRKGLFEVPVSALRGQLDLPAELRGRLDLPAER